jgi:hypothetical protein
MAGRCRCSGLFRPDIRIGEPVTLSLLAEVVHLMLRPARVSAREHPYGSELRERAAM